jgi:hypothetical protein
MMRSKRSKTIVDSAIAEYVRPLLTEAGFSSSAKSFFYRWDGDCFSRIWIFTKDPKGLDESYVHMTFCVGFRSLTEFLREWDEAPLDVNVKQPCNMAADILKLLPVMRPLIHVGPEDDLDKLGILLRQEIEQYGIPYIRTYQSLERSIEAWQKGRFFNSASVGVYLLAAAYFITGRRKQSLELVDQRINEEQLQVASGAAPVGALSAGEMDFAVSLRLDFDVMARNELARLRSFRRFLETR